VNYTYEIAVGILLWFDSTSVKKNGSALLLSALDDIFDSLLGLWTNDGSDVSAFLETSIYAQLLRTLSDLWNPILCLANHDQSAQCHATLAGGTKSGTDDSIESMVLVAVWKNSSVVLGTQVGLDTLSICRTTSVNVFSSLVAANKGDSLDAWFVNDEVYSWSSAVNNVDNARWEAGLFSELS
jgi:hypothetical protein